MSIHQHSGQNLHRVCYNGDVDVPLVSSSPSLPFTTSSFEFNHPPAPSPPICVLPQSYTLKQPSIITETPLPVSIAPIHPPSKGLISALPLQLVPVRNLLPLQPTSGSTSFATNLHPVTFSAYLPSPLSTFSVASFSFSTVRVDFYSSFLYLIPTKEFPL